MSSKAHWESIYDEKQPDDVSWHQAEPRLSLQLIEAVAINKEARILDVGGGASRLASFLLAAGYKNISVLDISQKTLQYAKAQLDSRGDEIEWIASDILSFSPKIKLELWHDRALFHFLTDPKDRQRYVDVLKRSLNADGYVMIASFAIDGPTQCSGLPIVQYDGAKLSNELGAGFTLLKQEIEIHRTPWGADQKFIYCLFQRKVYL